MCAKYNVYLLSDEIHADFGLTRRYTTVGRFLKTHDKLVIYTAISKSFNMAGLGSSCMIVPNEKIRNKIIEAYDSRWMFGPCDLAYTAIEAAYTYGDKWMDEQCDYLEKNAEYVKEYLAEYAPQIKVTEHEGTFLMWLNMRCFEKSSNELTEILAKEYGIALGDGSHYGSQADGFMRLNIGCPMATLKSGLEQIAKMYADHIYSPK